MNIFLGDDVTITKGDVWVTGKVNGIKLDKSHLEMLSVEGIPVWFNMGHGWRVADEVEEIEFDD